MIVTMGNTGLSKDDVKAGAKEWAATEGKALGSGIIGAFGDLLGDKIRGGSSQGGLYDPPGAYISQPSASLSPVAIGGLALAGVLVVALVARK